MGWQQRNSLPSQAGRYLKIRHSGSGKADINTGLIWSIFGSIKYRSDQTRTWLQSNFSWTAITLASSTQTQQLRGVRDRDQALCSAFLQFVTFRRRHPFSRPDYILSSHHL
jgi:hypothetical protein